MNLKYIISLAILLIFLSGCSHRQTSSISQSTSQTTPSEPVPPKTEIKAKGFGGLEMIIAPSTDKVVKGIVTITLSKVPQGTGVAAFGINGQGVEFEGPNLGLDTDGSDGWSYILDTTKYDNGVYSIVGIVAESFEEGKEPTGAATAQVIIQN